VSTEKGNFSAEIGQDVIEAALRSVEKRPAASPAEALADAASGEVEVPLEVEASAEDASASASETAADANAAETPPESAPSPEAQELESLRAQLEFSTAKGRETLEKLRDTHEKMLRAVADLDNFKKRAAKEKEEVQKFGVERLLKDFLPVADNLDRALEHAKGNAEDPLFKGVEMVRKLLDDTLGKHGVKSHSAVGKPFDPRLHEAIQQQESAEVAENTVVAELVRGYTLHERLVRPALVVVSKAPPKAAEAPSAESQD
jgi:molecular chaperone GrpE